MTVGVNSGINFFLLKQACDNFDRHPIFQMAILYSLKKTESNLVAGYRISIGIRSGISEVAPISIVYCKIRND
jgi:hypothetical protein